MMFRNPLSRLILAPLIGCTLLGCSGSGSPVEAAFGAGTIAATVGPGGAEVRGAGGTPLAGFVLTIPPGALTRLIRLEIRLGSEIPLPRTDAVSVPLSITTIPDPGPLAEPAALRMVFAYSEDRDPADLLVANRVNLPPAPRSDGSDSPPESRLGLAADFGEYDPEFQAFTAQVGVLADLQVRASASPRQIDDANSLVELGFASWERLTDASFVTADRQFAAALAADPYHPLARLLRGVSRVLVVLNDGSASGPGLQSIGEAATAFGLDLRSRSLLRRLVDNDWPAVIRPGLDLPAPGDVLEMLQTQLRPALRASLDDLALIPPQSVFSIPIPGLGQILPGDREVDRADVLFLGSLFAACLHVLDSLEDLVLTVDLDFLFSPAAAGFRTEDVLARFPTLGTRRTAPADRTLRELNEALFALSRGFASLNQETDAQEDDLIAFSSSFGNAQRDRWQENLEGLFRSFSGAGPHPVRFEGRRAVVTDLRALVAGFDPRAALPQFHGFIPLAFTLTDPTFAGLLPEENQDSATRLFRFANLFDLQPAAIVVDGDGSDWPAAAEALRPSDRSGDSGPLTGLDLSRMFVAVDGDNLAWRLTLADGPFVHDPGRTAAYGFTLSPERERPTPLTPGPVIHVQVEMTATGPVVTVRRDGQAVPVTHEVAVSGSDLELEIDRFDVFPPDEPVRDRVLRAFSSGIESSTGAEGGDETRRVLFRF